MTTEETNFTLCCPRPSSGQDPNVPIIAVSSKPVDCPPNHILLKVAKFGFSANNVTYQTLGEHSHFRQVISSNSAFMFLTFLSFQQGTLTFIQLPRQLVERALQKRTG